MASKDFVAVSWTADQIIDEDTLDQINNNLVWLRNNSVQGKYTHLNGAVTGTGVKMLCGRKMLTAPKSDRVTGQVKFGQVFTAGTIPVITTSIVSPSGKSALDHILMGIDDNQPNHQGFKVKVVVNAGKKKQDNLAKPIYINWIAMGY